MGSRGGRYRLSHREMLSYGFKYGEPWGEDRRALESAFREEDTRSENSRSSESTWTTCRSGFGSTHGSSTLSTLSSVSTLSPSVSSSGTASASYWDTWSGSERAHSSAGMEVVRVGEGHGRARSLSRSPSAAASGRASSTGIPSPPRNEDNGASAYLGWRDYQPLMTTRPTYERQRWRRESPYEDGLDHAWWDVPFGRAQSSSYGTRWTEENTHDDYASNGSYYAEPGTADMGSPGYNQHHDHAYDSDLASRWDDLSDELESGSTYDGPGSDSEYGSYGSIGSGSEEDSFSSESDDPYEGYSD
ncbi:hypothetical protein LshimejAT787_0109810 [Lyophyllum shimeji]|uniref:Uncharacterized protein n=1 Tax=Lyophyllum shimeji TaxID=47721 RepID=A0A9P3PEQ3_LYOSH|nr:hypothetical protein LshimejAT787_0109810 [Lyophyllum shimeji]